MKLRSLLPFAMLLSYKISFTQNLVPNPSFELYDTCPNTVGQIDNHVSGWYSYGQSPDYFNSCALQSTLVSVPYNGWGKQPGSTGQAYSGFQTWSYTANYREIVGCQLTTTLTIAQKYFVSFMVVAGKGGYFVANTATNKLGALFSTVPYSNSVPSPISNFAHVYSDSVISDTINWVRISGSFIADSAYQYVGFGNFFNDANTDTTHFLTSMGYRAYYFIDDICISTDSIPCSFGAGVENTFLDKIKIFPNPASNYLNIQAEAAEEEFILVDIYNLYGQTILRQSMFSKNETIDIRFIKNGAYFIKISSGKNQFGKIIIISK